MQTPSASDPSFKTFLEDLQKQNNQSFVTQIFQLKAEREIAGKDGDKREEQLHDINETLKNLKGAITGIKLEAPAIDFTPVIDSLSNVTEVLLKSLEEHSVLRKISEGRVKFDADTQRYHLEGKEARNKMVKEADVRTTSTKDAMAAPVATRNRGPVNSKDLKIQGKLSEDASVEDIAAARGAVGPDRGSDLTEPALRLKPINYTPGKAAKAAVGGKEKGPAAEEEVLDKTVFKGFFEEIKSGFKFFMTDGLSEVPGYGAYQEPPKDVEKKEREAKVSSPRQENPEADNISSTGEVQADAAKSDLELSKQMLDTTREQLTVLKEIRDALAPKTPGELIQGGPKGTGTPSGKEEEGGGGSLLGDLASGAMDLLGGGKKAAGALAGKAAGIGGKILGGAQALGGKAVGFANSGAGKLLGSAAAVGLGAYTAYKGYTAAEDSKQVKMEEVQAKVDSGEMKPEEAAAARQEIGNTATVEKSGAIGEGTGMAAGAIAGAKLGATVGTFFGGPVGTAVGGLAGGALGAFAGSKAGKVVGEYGGKAINAAGSFFGGIGDKVKGAYGDAKETVEQAKNFVGDTAYTVGATAGANIDKYTGLSKQVGKAKDFLGIKPDTSQVSDAEGTKTFDKEGNLIKQASPTFMGSSTETDVRTGDVTSKYSQGPMQVAQTKFAAGGSQSTGSYDLGPAIVKTRKTLTAKQQAEADLASGISPEAPVSSKSTVTGAIEGESRGAYAVRVSKSDFNEKKSVDEIAMAEAKKYGRDTPNIDDKKAARLLAKKASDEDAKIYSDAYDNAGGEGLGVVQKKTIAKDTLEAARARRTMEQGSTVAQTSTENADMAREASGRGSANNTVVSNNVSSNNTTKIVPMKASPRPEYTGSSLDRYTNRITVY